MSRAKDGTARIAMFKELGIANIFTMEASFCGPDKGNLNYIKETIKKNSIFADENLTLKGLNNIIKFNVEK